MGDLECKKEGSHVHWSLGTREGHKTRSWAHIAEEGISLWRKHSFSYDWQSKRTAVHWTILILAWFSLSFWRCSHCIRSTVMQDIINFLSLLLSHLSHNVQRLPRVCSLSNKALPLLLTMCFCSQLKLSGNFSEASINYEQALVVICFYKRKKKKRKYILIFRSCSEKFSSFMAQILLSKLHLVSVKKKAWVF